MTGQPDDLPSAYEAEGIPEPDPGPGAGRVIDENPEPPHDRPVAAVGFGTTPAEVREGESLDGRLARELPDLPEPVEPDAPPGVGRVVQPDEGVRTDTDKDMVAQDAGTDVGGYTAEEAAMHAVPDDPGAAGA